MNNSIEALQADQAKIQELKAKKLEEQVIMRRVAERAKNLQPFPRPKKTNLKTENRFYEIKKAKFQNGHYVLHTSYITRDGKSSLADLPTLEKITLNEMKINYHHVGHYLKCTVVAEPFYASGMHLLISDSNKDVEHLVLYNYETNAEFTTDPKFILPVGTDLIIKEPDLQYFGLEGDDFGIRVDSPSDVVICLETKDLIETDSLVNEANRLFGLKHYHQASMVYTLAIEKSQNLSVRALLNRAQCFLKLEKYQAAYEDAKRASELEDIQEEMEEKAWFRMGKALYEMRRFEEARDCFIECLNLSENKQADIEQKRAEKRLREAETGNYDFKDMYDKFFKREEMKMDIADFRSKKIMVADVPNKAKGMVACETIAKGSLLLVSKASSSVFNTRVDSRLKAYNLVQCNQGSYNSRNEVENVANLIHAMSNNPKLAREVYSLYAGPGFSREPVSDSLIDVQRIEAICVFNSFLIKSSYELLQLKEMEEDLEKMPGYNEDDFGELDLGSIEFQSEQYKKLAAMQLKYENMDKQCGLWYAVSFFNHSCLANCSVQFIGDVIVIHACRDIQQGEEVTIRYFPPDLTYTQRNQRALESYGFKCDCQLCQLDSQDPMNNVREQFLEKIENKNMNERVTSSDALKDLQKVKITYSKRPHWQLLITIPLEILAQAYKNEGNNDKMVECLEEIFELIKEFNELVSITTLMRIANILKQDSQAKRLNKCKKIAFEFFKNINFHQSYAEKIWQKMLKLD